MRGFKPSAMCGKNNKTEEEERTVEKRKETENASVVSDLGK